MDFKKIGQKILFGLKWFYHSYIWLFVVFFIVDLVTKLVIVNYFSSHTDPIILLGTESHPFLQINYSINDKAAFGFGIPNNPLANRIIYCIVAFLGTGAIIGVYVYNFKKNMPAIMKASLMLMLTGALGNLVDRLFYSPSFLHSEVNGVVDWIDFAGIWAFIFNIADSCVVIGTFMLLIYLIIDEVKATKKTRAKEVKESGGKVLSKEEQSRLEKNQPAEAPKEENKEEVPEE